MFDDIHKFWDKAITYCFAGFSIFMTRIASDNDIVNMDSWTYGALMAMAKLAVPLLTSIKLSWDLYNMYVKWRDSRLEKSLKEVKKKVK